MNSQVITIASCGSEIMSGLAGHASNLFCAVQDCCSNCMSCIDDMSFAHLGNLDIFAPFFFISDDSTPDDEVPGCNIPDNLTPDEGVKGRMPQVDQGDNVQIVRGADGSIQILVSEIADPWKKK